VAWEDRWKLNWRVTVETTAAIEKSMVFNEGYETNAFSVSEPYPDSGNTHAFILADFKERSSLDKLIKKIKSSNKKIKLEHFLVENEFWQLQVDLGIKEICYFSKNNTDADIIENLCRAHGGWPTFEERINALG